RVCFCTNKKCKVEGSNKGKEDKKNVKMQIEDPHDVSSRANKEIKNIIPQQAEQAKKVDHTQTTETHVLTSINVKKQSWNKIVDNDTEKLKDITNISRLKHD
ncbi:18545_t:CDS:1, partial [Gigaspora margarita]